ncbi:MAG: NifU family protein [Clostridium sp.]|jgi:Fe-S cluster biogenesis protein NfuA|uniref:NifU family protein n=1 Tax=Clostridium sp. TaxID=1506 RepID=UPI0025BE3186|nr:NifU family protein [Clostridium sp.]MCH3964798.1 NifU family protein [Clostridium sp.]MCI1715269.1 NifU family protein [Clostridium sp.]MCI1799531.1 NifU family protein [Clostridium sp.]MCI1813452.1 NifU family protein [Clostridium sp.]MCI1870343.1 NifU family protein [Clostridium sp.]
MNEKVLKVIDEKVRPYLNSHNGDVQILDIKDGVVKIRLLGQCGNCISAKYTVHDIIESAIKKEISGIKGVELIDYISEDTLNMARKILSKHA